MRIARVLELRSLGESSFQLDEAPEMSGRLLGAGVIASSIIAAARTVPAHGRPASIQTTFLRAGASGVPLDLDVLGVHDGRSLSVRETRASQGERLLAKSTIRFQADVATDFEWQDDRTSPIVAPEEGSREDAVVSTMALLDDLEIRAAVPAGSVERRVFHPFWIRAPRAREMDSTSQHALLGLLTDLGVSASASPPGTPTRERRLAATLDHCLWWHRPVELSEWLCLDAGALINSGGRGFARGTVHDFSGRLVASFAQEVLLDAGAPRREVGNR
jgi:acyl-CoA thioesterase II